MAGPFLRNMCLQVATTSGTGTFSLAAAVAPYDTISAKVGTGNTCFYVAKTATQKEWGRGTITVGTPDTLARTEIYGGDNGTSAVNFSTVPTIQVDLLADFFPSPIAPNGLFFGTPDGRFGQDAANLTWDNTNKRLTTPLSDKGGMVYDVRAYGVVGDGTTDDAPAIQTVINLAAVAGGTVLFAAGLTYAIASTLTLKNDVILELLGGTTIKWIGASGGVMFNTLTSTVTVRTGIIGWRSRIDANGLVGVVFDLHSVQYSEFGGYEVINTTATSYVYNLRSDSAVLTGGVQGLRNTVFNTFKNLMVSSPCLCAYYLKGSTGSPITLNRFEGLEVTQCVGTGINLVQWCDNNYFTGYQRISVTANNGFGVVFNTSDPGTVVITNVTTPGTLYTTPPTPAFTGGLTAGSAPSLTANVVGGVILSVTVVSGGTGFRASGTRPVLFVNGANQTATGTITVNGSGVITSAAVTFGGSGYPSGGATVVTLNSQVSGFTTIAAGAVTFLYIVNDGGGALQVAPTVSFSGGGGSGAVANCVLGGTSINSAVYANSFTNLAVDTFAGFTNRTGVQFNYSYSNQILGFHQEPVAELGAIVNSNATSFQVIRTGQPSRQLDITQAGGAITLQGGPVTNMAQIKVNNTSTFTSDLGLNIVIDLQTTVTATLPITNIVSLMSIPNYIGSSANAVICLWANPAYTGGGSVSLTANVYASNPTKVGTISNCYAFYCEAITSGNANWCLYSLGAATPSAHAGNFMFGQAAAPSYGIHGWGGSTRHQALPGMGTPTFATGGAAGTTRYAYYVVAKDRNGLVTAISNVGIISTGNATLTGTNFVTINWSAVAGAVSYDVIRIASGGTPSSVGSVALATALLTFNDTGIAASAYTAPTRNTTADVTVDGVLTRNQTAPTSAVHSRGGQLRLEALATPGTVTLAVTGTNNSVTYSYYVVARDDFGNKTLASATATTAAGPTTLNCTGSVNTGAITLTWTAVPGATSYDVIRSAGGGTQGVISTVTNLVNSVGGPGSGTVQFIDTGLAATAYTTPPRNATADAIIDGNVIVGPMSAEAVGTAGITTTSVSSTTSAETKSLIGTIVGTFTCPANFMVVGRKLRLRLNGVLTTGATAGTITFFVKFAGTTIASTGAVAPTISQTNKYWEAEIDIVCRTVGATGTFFVQGDFKVANAATPSALVSWPIRGNSADPPAAVTVDTTASSLVDCQSTTSNALHTITCNMATLEILN